MKLICYILFFLLCFGSFSGHAQERVKISGEIIVHEGLDSEGITIYNKTSGTGTVSEENGMFRLLMKVGDSLFFSGIQFGELFVVVDQGTMDSGHMQVEILDRVNELPEIVISPHDLSGNLSGDIKSMELESLEFPTASQINDQEWLFQRDSHTSPENAAMGNKGEGVNLLGLVDALTTLIRPGKSSQYKTVNSRERTGREKIGIERQVRSAFEDAYFEEIFNIPTTEISQFLTFCVEAGFDTDILKKENEFFLIHFLMEQSQKYRALNGSQN